MTITFAFLTWTQTLSYLEDTLIKPNILRLVHLSINVCICQQRISLSDQFTDFDFFILGQPTLIKRNLIKNFLFNIKNAVNMNFSLIKLLFNDVLVINDVKPLIINDIYEINTIYTASVKPIISSKNCHGYWKDDW